MNFIEIYLPDKIHNIAATMICLIKCHQPMAVGLFANIPIAINWQSANILPLVVVTIQTH